MALITAIAGAYVGTYRRHDESADLPLGITRQGYTLAWTIHEHRSAKSISYGRTLLEGVYLGADWTLALQAREYLRLGALSATWPWGTTAPDGMDETFPVAIGQVGRRATDNAGVVILTSTTGTPADGSPATLTAYKAIQAGNRSSMMRMDSVLRELPILFQLYPFESDEFGLGLTGVWFETT